MNGHGGLQVDSRRVTWFFLWKKPLAEARGSSLFSPLRIDYLTENGYEGNRLGDFAATVWSFKEGKWKGCLVPS
jgi:hypothetical protein